MLDWIATGIELTLFVDDRWRLIANGLAVTLIIAVAAQILGTILGGIVCFGMCSKNKIICGAANFYLALIFGMPIVVLLMIAYYIVFGGTNISGVFVAISAFTLVAGAIVADNIKTAYDAVDPVEIEAARGLGFSRYKAFRAVTLPQMIRLEWDSYTYGFIELLKSTAIVGYVGTQDLTQAINIIQGNTDDAYFPIIFLAIIYLAITMTLIWLLRFLAKKMLGGFGL
ncbi:MAG: ABC transporter permease subunit [Defluviitaleaceae bacterium]|nr:ABC transporter permease subunit [Defluviitaleaceae bacterium]